MPDPIKTAVGDIEYHLTQAGEFAPHADCYLDVIYHIARAKQALAAFKTYQAPDLSKLERWTIIADWDRNPEGRIEVWVRHLKEENAPYVRYADVVALMKGKK